MSSEPGSSKNAREEKKAKQQMQLNAAFGDSLLRFSIPDVVRKHSAEINGAAQDLQERIRTVSATSQERIELNNDKQAKNYVETRQSCADDAAVCLKKSKNAVKELREQGVLERSVAKRAHKELDDSDKELLKERAALAANRVKLQYGILAHPTHSRIGEAYLAAIVESLPEPAGARVLKHGPRSGTDQSSFRQKLMDNYNPPDWNKDPLEAVGWCPVTKEWINPEFLTAALIVPYALGNLNVAYLFGLDPQDGYEAIWDIKNGMMLSNEMEKAFDAARIVIVEDEDSKELKLVVLDESLMGHRVGAGSTPRFRDFHNQRLEFVTDARPGRRHLYLHYLLTLFRRKRFNVEGWESDSAKVTSGYIWGSPGPWLRRSIIQALAFEIGDVERLDKEIDDFPNQVSHEQEKGMAVQMRQAIVETEEEE